jgi:hypothetical protein
MSTLAESLGEIKKSWHWCMVGGGILLACAALATPNLMRTRVDADRFVSVARSEAFQSVALTKADAAAERKIIRTSSIDMVYSIQPKLQTGSRRSSRVSADTW